MGVEDGALPVRVDVDARMTGEVLAHLEGTLGWQATRGDELPAALAVVGVAADVPTDVPAVLLVRDDDPAARAAVAAHRARAVLRWPHERDGLGDVAARLLGEGADPRGTVVRVGGAAGGVGTTTVAMALGGLVAWHGRPALVVASGDVPLDGVAVVAPEALAGHRTWDAATAVPGVSGLRVVGSTHPGAVPVAAPDEVVVLHDRGVGTEVDLLVCVRDRAGLAAVDRTPAGAVVVGDRGAVDPGAWARTTAGRAHQVLVPWSSRVGRAGAVRRVPASLPGRWLATLDPLARSLMG